jgi:hypothetical protein
MQRELRKTERAVAIATRDAGRGLKTELRRQVASVGLGQRLANSWRDRYYPNQKLDAASLVYTKAPQIIRAFDEGAVIRSKRGRFLAIPIENAPGRGPTASGSGRALSRSISSGRSGLCPDPADRRSWSRRSSVRRRSRARRSPGPSTARATLLSPDYLNSCRRHQRRESMVQARICS